MGRRKRRRAEAGHPVGNDITTELSLDILFFHLIPRLPLKSVRRFRCVSKQWQSFLTSAEFVKMHSSRHVPANNLVVLSATTQLFHTMDCERPEEGFTAGRPFPFEVGPHQRLRILTSAHGLVCIGIFKVRRRIPDPDMLYITDDGKTLYSGLIIWNPTTDEHKTLSKPIVAYYRKYCYNTEGGLFGLYHSDGDDYKLLRINHRGNVYRYSLKSDSWTTVDFRTRPTLGANRWGPSVWWNETLYALGGNVLDLSYTVMRFNAKRRTLKLIKTPLFFGRKSRNYHIRTTWLTFTVDDDERIQLWVNIENSLTLSSENQLWRMDGDGNWTKVVNTNPMLFGDDDTFRLGYHHRLPLMRNGNLLIHREGSIYELDMKTQNKVLRSYTDSNQKMLSWAGGKYIETSVSPNQYIK